MTFTGYRDGMNEKAARSRIAHRRSVLAGSSAAGGVRLAGMPAAAVLTANSAAVAERQQGCVAAAAVEYIKMNRQTGAGSRYAATPFLIRPEE